MIRKAINSVSDINWSCGLPAKTGKAMSVLFGILFALLAITGSSSKEEALQPAFDPYESTVTHTQDNITSITSSPPLSFEDFVAITQYQMLAIFQTLRYTGNFEGHMSFVDKNNTRYIVITVTAQEEARQLKEKLANYPGHGLICVAGRCRDKALAEKVLQSLEDEIARRLRSDEVLPFAIMTSVFAVVGLLGITGNSLIISGVLQSKKLQNSTSVFLSGLALSDILVLIMHPILQVNRMFLSTTSFLPIPVCKLLQYTKHFAIVISSFTMACTAIDRYIAICHPLKAKSYCTVKNARNCTLFIWTFSMALCIPVIFMVRVDDGKTTFCLLRLWKLSEAAPYYTCVLCTVFGLPIMIILPAYIKIFTVLWKSTKDSGALNSTGSLPERSSTFRMRRQVVKMLVAFLLAFIICWGPTVVFDMAADLHRRQDNSIVRWMGSVSVALNSLGICNSFFNPLIYFIFSRQFRDYALRVCACIACRRGKARECQSSSDSTTTARTGDTTVRSPE